MGKGKGTNAQPQPAVKERIPLCVAVYGEPGAGKSHFLADFPKPLLVWLFDPPGKAVPYYKQGVLDPGLQTNKYGTPFRRVVDAKGELVVQVELYHDQVFDRPDAYSRFLDRVGRAHREIGNPFASFAFDSVSLAAFRSRKFSQYDAKSDAKNPLQWYGDAADQIEDQLMGQLPGLSSHANVGVSFHISKTKVESEGTMVRGPWVPGKRLAETNMVMANYPEFYRIYVERSAKDPTKRIRYLQTESDETWIAATQIGAPDPCRARWESLWVNW